MITIWNVSKQIQCTQSTSSCHKQVDGTVQNQTCAIQFEQKQIKINSYTCSHDMIQCSTTFSKTAYKVHVATKQSPMVQRYISMTTEPESRSYQNRRNLSKWEWFCCKFLIDQQLSGRQLAVTATRQRGHSQSTGFSAAWKSMWCRWKQESGRH